LRTPAHAQEDLANRVGDPRVIADRWRDSQNEAFVRLGEILRR
jgi:hypothetical protein